jgi:SAM-dependent methyltransferase
MTEHAPEIFDRALYLARQSRASATEILQNHVASELVERLSFIMRSFPNSLLVMQSTDIVAKSLQLSGKIENLEMAAPSVDDNLKLANNKYDAVFSLLDLHCVNDVPGHLAQLGRSLKPDGLLVVAFFAGDTLSELRESWLNAELEITGGVSPRVAPMIGLRELGGLMQRAGLALPVADTDHTTVRYNDVFALMREIKSFGYANPLVGRSTKFVSKRFITKMAEHYHTNYNDDDGRIRATLEITWAMAWRPHDSQQKPLKPGSASHRLADILKTQS